MDILEAANTTKGLTNKNIKASIYILNLPLSVSQYFQMTTQTRV